MPLSAAQLISQIYIGYYDRAPDPSGLSYWLGRYNAGMSLSDIAQSFSVQVESVGTYPYLANPASASVATFLTSVYANLFNRAPDTAGLGYWTGEINSGRSNVGNAIINIISGAQGADITTLANKATAGQLWASAEQGAGVTYPNPLDLSNPIVQNAHSIIAAVTSDPASVTNANIAINTFFAPSFTVSASGNINEGQSEVFTIATKNVAAGSLVAYTIAGTGNASGQTQSGNAVVDASGFAKFTVQIPANSNVGDAGTLTMSLANGKALPVSVSVADVSVAPPAPTYSITNSGTSNTITEGQSVNFTISTTGVAAGSQLAYTLAGTGNAAGQTTNSGLVTIDATGRGVVSVAVPTNSTVGDTGTLKLSLANGAASSNTITITDTTTPPTLTLQTGIDNLVGTVGNDTFNAIIGTGATLTGLDQIDGGAGTDTINISDATGGTALPASASISNVEIINVRSVGAVGIDTSKIFTGATNLNVTTSTGADTITAGSGQAVSVVDTAGKVTLVGGSSQTVNTAGGYILSKATGAVQVTDTAQANVVSSVTGGTSVNVVSTSTTQVTSGSITIGGAGALAPTGAVSLTSNLVNAAGADMAGGAITVTGGTVVTVNQTAAQAVASALGANNSITEATVTINGSAVTTAATVNQAAKVASVATAAAVAGITETHSLVFTGMLATDTITVNGLTFTAAGTLTAAQTAAAFANLSNGATQGSSTLGTYSGTFNTTAYTSGPVTGTATVLLTSNVAGPVADVITAVTGAAVAPVDTKIDGVTAAAATGTGGVAAGNIVIVDTNYVS